MFVKWYNSNVFKFGKYSSRNKYNSNSKKCNDR